MPILQPTNKINPIKKYFFNLIKTKYWFKWLLLCCLIGTLSGVAAAIFLQSLNWVTVYRTNHEYIIYLSPIAGLLIGWLYYYWGKNIEAGNNILIETVHKPTLIVPFKMAPMVYLSTIITHLFGGSAGREGTALQMSGAIADQFSKSLQLTENDRSILMTAAIAAGFGAVFGTPIAGAVFALEVALYKKISYNAMLPAFAASFIANYVTQFCKVYTPLTP